MPVKKPQKRTKVQPKAKPHEKRGPKPKLLATEQTLDQIRALGKLQCSMEEAASVLRVSRRTLFNFFDECEDAREAYDDGKLEGLVSLRRKQFLLADKNAGMAIWLGKQYLGQTDLKQVEIGGPGAFDQMSIEQLQAYLSQDDAAELFGATPGSDSIN